MPINELVQIELTPSPFIPLPPEGKGEIVLRGGLRPLFLFLPLKGE